MESGSKSLDAKKLVRLLCEAPEAQTEKDGNERGVSPRDLDARVYKRLFLPIVAEKPILLEGLDFSEIAYEDLDDLADALQSRDLFEFLNLGNAFIDMRPAASAKQTFI